MSGLKEPHLHAERCGHVIISRCKLFRPLLRCCWMVQAQLLYDCLASQSCEDDLVRSISFHCDEYRVFLGLPLTPVIKDQQALHELVSNLQIPREAVFEL